MRVFLFFCLVAMSSGKVFAQIDVNRFSNILSSVNGGTSAYGIGMPGQVNISGDIIGHPFVDSSYQKLHLVLYSNNDHIAAKGRYNIVTDEFEMNTSLGLRAVKGVLVKGFYAVSHGGDTLNYINAKDYKLKGTPLIGFFLVKSRGKMLLLEKQDVEIIKPTYKLSLDTGDRNAYLNKKFSYYCTTANSIEVIRIKKIDDLYGEFGQHARLLEEFVKKNKYGSRDLATWQKVVDYYNSL